MRGCVGGKNANLAVLDFADAAATLFANADRFVCFFYESTFVENQDTIGCAHIFIDKIMILI
jgi:hypothetical protein